MRIPVIISLISLLSACAVSDYGSKQSIGSLNREKVDIEDPVIGDTLERAMRSYRQFLEKTPDGEVTPEAMRRLADLQLEANSAGYDYSDALKARADEINTQQGNTHQVDVTSQSARRNSDNIIDSAELGKTQVRSPIMNAPLVSNDTLRVDDESDEEFERRATRLAELLDQPIDATVLPGGVTIDPATSKNTVAAIKLYLELLQKYPLYERNDEVLYQLARAYEEAGRQDKAMETLGRIIQSHPDSRHIDETYFRRGEIFFVNRQYYEAEQSYAAVINIGARSSFYDQSLFKRGWSFFKQGFYPEGLEDFIALLDVKTGAGYHLDPEANKTEYQRIQDTLRVISLSFSYMEGPPSVKRFFDQTGPRTYEDLIYQDLGEHYLDKRRYSDAAQSYAIFTTQYPLHAQAPTFQMRIIDIYRRGNFPKLVIDGKRQFAITYALENEFWTYHDIDEYPETLAFIKTNLTDLAQHYHALSQRAKKAENRQQAYVEAVRWYKGFLTSFPEDQEAPNMNFLLAEILFDNKAFAEAADEYERTAYGYPKHDKAAESGYAAVLSFREYESVVTGQEQTNVHKEMIRSSLQFAETYPEHPEAAAVLTSAAENLFELNEFERAIAAAEDVVTQHPNAKPVLLTSSWIVIAHSQFDLNRFPEAEGAYTETLKLLPAEDEKVTDLNERLAASIYKQGEIRQQAGDLEGAIVDYLRIADAAPTAKIRANAEYDAAAALITLENWSSATNVLVNFRNRYPENPLQFDVTEKLAFVYQQDGKKSEAAAEYERISYESDDQQLVSQSLQLASVLFEEAEQPDRAITVLQRYISLFPTPVEPALESRQKLAALYDRLDRRRDYFTVLKDLVTVERQAGDARNDRTRYLGAKAMLVLVEPVVKSFNDARLGEPFQQTLKVKTERLNKALAMFNQMLDYQVAEVTSAATYKMAGMYLEYSGDLLDSERPRGLNSNELAEYELLLEERAFPYEDKAIEYHIKNLELHSTGVYNGWIEQSLSELARLQPVRYAKTEEGIRYATAIQ